MPSSPSKSTDDLQVADFFPSTHVIDDKVLEVVLDDRPAPPVRRAVSWTFRILFLLLGQVR